MTAKRDLGIGSPGKAGELLGTERRPGPGHIEPAIIGEAGEKNVCET